LARRRKTKFHIVSSAFACPSLRKICTPAKSRKARLQKQTGAFFQRFF